MSIRAGLRIPKRLDAHHPAPETSTTCRTADTNLRTDCLPFLIPRDERERQALTPVLTTCCSFALALKRASVIRFSYVVVHLSGGKRKMAVNFMVQHNEEATQPLHNLCVLAPSSRQPRAASHNKAPIASTSPAHLVRDNGANKSCPPLSDACCCRMLSFKYAAKSEETDLTCRRRLPCPALIA